MFGSLGSHTYTFPCVDICSAHAYSYCTRGGFALIPDCFGFCGGLIRLPLKLCAKPVCLHVCVYRSVLGVAQFRLLLLVLFYRPDYPPHPPSPHWHQRFIIIQLPCSRSMLSLPATTMTTLLPFQLGFL